ncbi:MAG: 30S ribosomal protein S20 [Candidatus Vogelbacteria bacterium]|nr:30S ribosomal protein S20 [Candidatus Vogelbacteria bacterium]
MPITSSAKKALRVSRRRRVFNLRRLTAMRTAIKKIRKMIAAGPAGEGAKFLPAVYQAIDKAKKRGVIKANAAARYKSRLARAIAKSKV